MPVPAGIGGADVDIGRRRLEAGAQIGERRQAAFGLRGERRQRRLVEPEAAQSRELGGVGRARLQRLGERIGGDRRPERVDLRDLLGRRLQARFQRVDPLRRRQAVDARGKLRKHRSAAPWPILPARKALRASRVSRAATRSPSASIAACVSGDTGGSRGAALQRLDLAGEIRHARLQRRVGCAGIGVAGALFQLRHPRFELLQGLGVGLRGRPVAQFGDRLLQCGDLLLKRRRVAGLRDRLLERRDVAGKRIDLAGQIAARRRADGGARSR